MALKNSRKIVVLATGGTIAGLAPDPLQPGVYQAGVLPVEDLLADHDATDLALVTEQVAQLAPAPLASLLPLLNPAQLANLDRSQLAALESASVRQLPLPLPAAPKPNARP